MSDDLDLRGIDQRHEPDPQFRAALHRRLAAIMEAGDPADAIEPLDVTTIELEAASGRAAPTRPSRWITRGAIAIASAAAIVAVIVIVSSRDDGSSPADTPSVSTSSSNGWVAFAAQSDANPDADLYIVREGSTPQRIAGSDTDGTDEVCPAFSPDGRRLLFGQAEGSQDDGYHDAVLVITDLSADGAPTRTATIALDGVARLPCAIWSPDGKWVAFGVATPARDADPRIVDEVWVVDTDSDDIRRLTGLLVTDIEWASHGLELAMAGNGVSLYSVTADETRSIGGAGADLLSWSPDSRTIAFTRRHPGTSDGPHDLVVMDADGTNERILVSEFDANHGWGPVWSPAGDRIAYQRLCDFNMLGNVCREDHEVALVPVTDDVSYRAGTQEVIPAPQTAGPDGPIWWYPWSVTWSPDGTALLYNAWPASQAGGTPQSGVVAVPVDGETQPVLLSGDLDAVVYSGFPWLPIQSWGRQADADAPSPSVTVDSPPASPFATTDRPTSAAAQPTSTLDELDRYGAKTDLAIGGLDAGTYAYLNVDGQGFNVRFTVPAGWTWNGRALSKGGVDQPDGAAIFFFGGHVQVYADPCHWAADAPSSATAGLDETGPVDALASQPMRSATTPTDRSVRPPGGGIRWPGIAVELTVPDDIDFADCDGGQFRSWGPENTARSHQGPGQRDLVWAVDMPGMVEMPDGTGFVPPPGGAISGLIIDAASFPGTPADVMSEIDSILESIAVGHWG